MIYLNKKCYVLFVMLSVLALSCSSRAEDENPLAAVISNPDDAERCVNLKLVDRTDIIEDGFILFYMRNKNVYLNVLPHSCPGLKNADSFMYRVTMHRLCDVDVITVLDRIGGGFYPGPTCGLGLFYPIDEKTAKGLSNRSK